MSQLAKGWYYVVSGLLYISSVACANEDVVFRGRLLLGLCGLFTTYFLLAGSDPGWVHTEEDAEKGVPNSQSQGDGGCELCGLKRRPLRTHHCRACNRCVATFDHHCHFLGQCVGELNHFRFFLFCATNLVVCHYTWHTLSPLAADPSSHASTQWVKELRLGMCFLLALLWSGLVALLGFHSWLVLTSSTSFEVNRSDKIGYLHGRDVLEMPFSKGPMANIKAFVGRDALFSFSSAKGKGDDETEKVFTNWELSSPRNIMSVTPCDDVCFNKYYNCC